LEKNKSASRPLAGRKSRTRKMARESIITRLWRELMQISGRRFQRENHTGNEKEKNGIWLGAGTFEARAVPADRACDGLEQGALPPLG
jgi:hypothetical protein